MDVEELAKELRAAYWRGHPPGEWETVNPDERLCYLAVERKALELLGPKEKA